MATPEILALAQRAQQAFLRQYAGEIRHLIDHARRDAFDAARLQVRSTASSVAPFSDAGTAEMPAAPPLGMELRAARALERMLAQRIRLEEILRRKQPAPAR